MIIAVDGPGGAGKSSICKIVSKKMNFEYIDTGAMYRACAYKLFKVDENIEINDENARKYLSDVNIDYKNSNIYLDCEMVEDKIRTPNISIMASNVSKIAFVREKMVEVQRKLSYSKDVILDGRDIGTVVFPDADFKFFVTASPEIRARRRFEELKEKGSKETYEKILENIKVRDDNDMNRKLAPLKVAENGIILDTSFLTLDEAVNKMIFTIKNKK